jgi:hypothetical protein
MDYKVIPFEPAMAGGDCGTVASALEGLVRREATGGWEYVGMENHSTVVPGDSGCFGIGATSAYPKTFSLVVFRK